jgi:hypothetical protein
VSRREGRARSGGAPRHPWPRSSRATRSARCGRSCSKSPRRSAR